MLLHPKHVSNGTYAVGRGHILTQLWKLISNIPESTTCALWTLTIVLIVVWMWEGVIPYRYFNHKRHVCKYVCIQCNNQKKWTNDLYEGHILPITTFEVNHNRKEGLLKFKNSKPKCDDRCLINRRIRATIFCIIL